MKNAKTLTLIGAVGLALLGSSAFAAEPVQLPESAATKAPAREKSRVLLLPTPPAKPTQSTRPALPADIKELVDKFNAARDKYLDEEKELRRKYADSSKEEREKLRTVIKDKRQDFLEQQKEAREEIRKRVTELKDQLKDHREVIDQAKEQVKEKVKDRKGGE